MGRPIQQYSYTFRINQVEDYINGGGVENLGAYPEMTFY